MKCYVKSRCRLTPILFVFLPLVLERILVGREGEKDWKEGRGMTNGDKCPQKIYRSLSRARAFVLHVFLLGILFVCLTACGKDADVVATLQGETILTREALLQEANTLDLVLHKGKQTVPAMTEDERQAFLLDVGHQLAIDKLIEADKSLAVDSASLSALAWQEALQRFGDEQGLMTQLQNLHLTKDAFLDSLRREAREKAHRTAYFAANPLTEEDLLTYYKKNPKQCTLLTYSQITVPTRAEAVEIVEKLHDSPREMAEYESVMNNDLFEKTSFSRFIDMGIDDRRVGDTDIFSQTLGTVDFYYDRERELYLVVYVEGRKEEMKDVREVVEKRVENMRYLNYLNRRAKDLDLRFYPKAILSPDA